MPDNATFLEFISNNALATCQSTAEFVQLAGDAWDIIVQRDSLLCKDSLKASSYIYK
jgi:hypothetical protein